MIALGIPLDVQKLLDNQRIKLAAALAFVDSFRLVMFIAVGLGLLSALIALLMIKKRKKADAFVKV